jgi:LytS/YehU family sensor histidine kinase
MSYLRGMNKPWDDVYKSLWYNSISFINSGPPVICAFFLGVSMLRKWYIGQEEKLNLVRANTNAELQLLKAQMHPHFLFNTLNNIYSFILTKHPSAASLVTKLTGMMSYMNTEGEKDRVPLEKEIQLIRDYINLERVRYGDRLDLQIEINGESSGKWIAPLLMLPFVENSFKHGASVMRGKQWMKLILDIGENLLRFDLQNSKPLKPVQQNGKKGIGLMNVQKRLELIYPRKHLLQIESSDMIYRVKLEIALDDQPVVVTEYIQQSSSQTFSYA